MTLSKKIVLVAIDAGERGLIRQWAGDGTLPVIRGLLSQALVGETTSVEGFYEGATWPCFYTGSNPARLGFHRLSQIRPGSYEFHRCYPHEHIRQRPFWEAAAGAGRRVAVLDVPLAGISEGLNGIQTVEWGSHDAVYGFQTWPPDLRSEVLTRFGTHPLRGPCDSRGRTLRGFRRFGDRLVLGVERKTEMTLQLLRREPWDLFIQVFTEAHCAGHQCWHLHDPSHPDHDLSAAVRVGDPLRDVYRAIDTAIGRLLEQVDDETSVILLAGHGMGHNVGADFLLEEILERLGLLERVPDGGPTGAGRVPPGRWAPAAVRAVWRSLPSTAQRALRPALSSLHALATRAPQPGAAPQLSPTIDLTRSSCFPHPNGGLVSGIRVNLAGREPAGIVAPGQELESLCRRLADDLLSLVHTGTGMPMVRRVLRTVDLFQGERLAELPDLLVEWNDQILVGSRMHGNHPSSHVRLVSDKVGTIEGDYSYCRTGDHRPGGLFAITGPDITPNALDRTVSLLDFAPTFLRWAGLPHDGLDGKAIEELFD